MKRLLFLSAAGAALLFTAGRASAAISVQTYPATPSVVHLTGVPKCATLRYRLSARAEDVELKIINPAGREVFDLDRETTGVTAGAVHSFRWCGQSQSGLRKVAPGTFRWRVEVDQAGGKAEGRSAWRTVSVVR